MPSRHGLPGTGPRHLLWRWRRNRALSALLIGAGLVLTAGETRSAWLWVTLGSLGVFGWVHSGGRIRRARSGVRGERDVALALGRRVIAVYGWSPPGSRYDVDVVVAWPTVAAIEVKQATGRVRVRRDGTVAIDGALLPGAPIRQAIRGAAVVRRHLRWADPVAAVLCITGMRQRPRWIDSNGTSVAVCSRRHLRRVLERLPRTDRIEAGDLLAVLGDERCSDEGWRIDDGPRFEE